MSLSGINLLSDQLERFMTTKFTLWTDTFYSSKFEKCPPLYSPLHLSLCALLFHGFLQLKYFFHKLQLNQNQRRRTTKQGQSPSKVSANLLFMTSALTGKGMLKALEKLACTLYKHLVHVHVYVGLFLRGIFWQKCRVVQNLYFCSLNMRQFEKFNLL